LSVHVILRFLSKKSIGYGKIHRPPMELAILHLIFEAKSIGCGKIHRALVEHIVLNLSFLKPNPNVLEKSTSHLWNTLQSN